MPLRKIMHLLEAWNIEEGALRDDPKTNSVWTWVACGQSHGKNCWRISSCTTYQSENMFEVMYSFTVLPLMFMTFVVSRSHSTTAPIVTTTYGPVSGSVTKLPTNKTVKSYLEIPFAKAERFEYPVPRTSGLQLCTQTQHAVSVLSLRLSCLNTYALSLTKTVYGSVFTFPKTRAAVLVLRWCCGFTVEGLMKATLYYMMVLCWQPKETLLS